MSSPTCRGASAGTNGVVTSYEGEHAEQGAVLPPQGQPGWGGPVATLVHPWKSGTCLEQCWGSGSQPRCRGGEGERPEGLLPGHPQRCPLSHTQPRNPPSGLTCPSPRGARVLPAAPVATCRSLTSLQTGGGVPTPAQLCAHPPEGAGTPNGCPAWVRFPLPCGRHPLPPGSASPFMKQSATQMIFRDPPGAHILSLMFKKNEMKVKGEAGQG